MKIKTLINLIAAASLSAPLVSTAETTVAGGKVNFIGEVVNAACAVSVGSTDQNVELGQIRTAKLAEAGKTSNAVGFNITLEDCDTSVSTTAAVAFEGTTIDESKQVLALSGGASGVATNVGIQIFHGTITTPLVLNGDTFTNAVTINDGRNVIPFKAKYYATGAATPGSANAEANFKIQYN
ncbi:fimbrial protein [Serratia ureilytica]|uniref:fimbrial protein n=1 Tax=Serratia ureilytica TaxID=300181 RepID=UPI0034C5DF86